MEGLQQDIFRHLVLALLLILPAWKICDKAGFNRLLAFIIFVPLAGYLILSLVLAFAAWPAATGQGRDGEKAS